jgi:hypothetical protein
LPSRDTQRQDRNEVLAASPEGGLSGSETGKDGAPPAFETKAEPS